MAGIDGGTKYGRGVWRNTGKPNGTRDRITTEQVLHTLVDKIDMATVSANLFTSTGGMVSGSSSYPIGSGINTDPFVTTTITRTPCEHIMGDETELVDGQVTGFCAVCGDKIRGRRMVGGFGLAKLKDAIVDALGDMDAMAGLLDEIDRVELMLKVEEQSIRSAYDMIEMARKMVKTIVLPESVEEDVSP